MIGAFSFNGIESLEFNLVCRSVKRPLLPPVKPKRVDMAGSSGAFDFPGAEYSLRPVTMRIMYLGEDYYELRTRGRRLAAWLSTEDWVPLIIHDEPGLYYNAKITSELDLQNLWESGVIDVVFDCQPFAMSIIEESVSYPKPFGTDFVFTNPGTRVINYKSPHGSKSRLDINGSWTNLTVSLNGVDLTYARSGSGLLIIDNIEMEATLNGVNQFDAITNGVDTFLQINPGKNVLKITGTGVNVQAVLSYIPLWL